MEKITCEHTNANASVPSARLTPPSFVIGMATNAPSAAATITPRTTAQKKLRWPCFAMPGMSIPRSHVSAQPAANPPAVTKLAWARLIMPPNPVTTTNDKKMIAMARLCAITVWS